MHYNTITRIAQGCCAVAVAAAIGTGVLLQRAPRADAAEIQEAPAQIVGMMRIPAIEIVREIIELHQDNERLIALQSAKRERRAALRARAEEPEIAEEETEPEAPVMTSLGYWDVTAYTWTGSRCANGEYPYEGLCAVNGLPFGTRVYIEGVGVLTVADRGGMRGKYDVDIYMDSEAACWQWGRQSREVWIVEE